MLRVGNGKSIKFWKDKWVGELSFEILFPRLYSLSIQKECFVFDVYQIYGGIIKWNLLFRRSLFVWEKELVEDRMRFILNSIVIVADREGSLVWLAEGDEVYSVRSLCKDVENNVLSVWCREISVERHCSTKDQVFLTC